MRFSVAILGLVFVGGALHWASVLGAWDQDRGGGRIHALEPQPVSCAALPESALQRAYGALTLGRLQDGSGATLAIDELDERHLECAAALIALTLRTYEGTDFDAFLCLRRGDLLYAQTNHPDRQGELEGLLAELAVTEVDGGGEEEWRRSELGLVRNLGRFWRSFYATPPVGRFGLEGVRVVMGSERIDGARLDEWESCFENLRRDLGGGGIDMRPMIPHRRALDELCELDSPLDWLDLDLPFRTPSGGKAHFLARFVWDAIAGEWFVHRAGTVYPERHDPRLDRAYLIV